MDLSRLKENWETLAERDPLWAILSNPSKKGRQWDPVTFFASGKAEIDQLMREVRRSGFALRRGTALDFGCGVGRLTQALCGHFEKCYGVDISSTMLTEAARYNSCGEACLYVRNEGANLDCFPGDTFDFIYSSMVLQHIPPEASKAYIREFVRVLKPGGLLIFQMPSTLRPGKEPAANLRRVAIERIRAAIVRWKGSASRTPEVRDQAAAEGLERLIDMYGVERAEVARTIEAARGDLLETRSDESAGMEWISYRYWVTKR